MEIGGAVDEGFGPLADEFVRNFSERGETGAAFSLVVDGRTVVDLWAGIADARTGRPWDAETLSVIFSCSKGLMTIGALRLAQDGRLDLDALVSDYWPEFARQGKEEMRVSSLLDHRAGLVALDRDLSLQDVVDWQPVIRAIEQQRPLWAPDIGYAYHTLMHGWLVGEIVRRVTGMMPGDYLHELFGRSLAPDTWLGIPDGLEDRVTHLYWASQPGDPAPLRDDESAPRAERIRARSATLGGAFPIELVDGDAGFNDPRIHRAQVPGAGVISTARDLARIWSATVVETDGIRLLERETTDAASIVRSAGVPAIEAPGPWPSWGTGFILHSPRVRPLLSDRSFGHDGAGGQLAFADPDARMGLGYLTNRLLRRDDGRSLAMLDATRRILG
ncbi:MAG: Carboxylesterase [Microbacteriaceae bacterium]|nr:Carboxylesterase [Microbacteriaceae bacterium]